MRNRFRLLALLASGIPGASAQVLDNHALDGQYFFRHTLIVTDASGAFTDARSLYGTITFDGAGSFQFAGRQLVGTAEPANLSGNGTYAVSPAGIVTLTNPQRTDAQLNARVGVGALAGSTTESGGAISDLFVAIAGAQKGITAGTLNGAYHLATLEFTNGAESNVRETFSPLRADGHGRFGDITVVGQARNLGDTLLSQTVTGSTYTLNADGSGAANFPASGDANGQLLSGAKTIYVSGDGSLILGGSNSAGGHGIIVGVKAFDGNAKNASWSGLFWTAGLSDEQFPERRLECFTGSTNGGGTGNVLLTRRVQQSASSATRADEVDFTGVNDYDLDSDGAGTVLFGANRFALASTRQALVGSGVGTFDSVSYGIYFGIRTPQVTGSGVFLNPLAVVNAASFAPAGNPIAPGELLALIGGGLAPRTARADRLPLPTMLEGVQVHINTVPAPLFYVSAGQVNVAVPFATAGPTATIVVTNNGVASNTVTVPVHKSAPGVLTTRQSGSGPGAILHLDGTAVNSNSPASHGEFVQAYLTGLGNVTPPAADGEAAPSNPPANTIATPTVYIGGRQAAVSFSGLAPTFAGLYQINLKIPDDVPSGPNPFAIQTGEAFHDQADIFIAP